MVDAASRGGDADSGPVDYAALDGSDDVAIGGAGGAGGGGPS